MLNKIKKKMRVVKESLKKNDKLYVLVKCIRHLNSPTMISLIRGYFYQPYNNLTLILNGPSSDVKETVYYINIGVGETRETGFCVLLRYTISALAAGESLGLVPFVEWGNGLYHYYDNGMDSETRNVFLYYFNPVSHINQIKDKQFIYWRFADIEHLRGKKWTLYQSETEELNFCAEAYKKYIQLNQKTADYISENVKSIIQNYRVLGIHARGTDYGVGYEDHPKIISSNIYAEKAKELFGLGNYDKVFIATDDINILNSFIGIFDDKLLYYEDVFRTSGNLGPHSTENNRPFHHYKLGLEVLRDVYTLAQCNGLICNLSHVSFTARYVNLALNRHFDELIVLNSEINDKPSKLAKEFKKAFKHNHRA